MRRQPDPLAWCKQSQTGIEPDRALRLSPPQICSICTLPSLVSMVSGVPPPFSFPRNPWPSPPATLVMVDRQRKRAVHMAIAGMNIEIGGEALGNAQRYRAVRCLDRRGLGQLRAFAQTQIQRVPSLVCSGGAWKAPSTTRSPSLAPRIRARRKVRNVHVAVARLPRSLPDT